MEGREKEMGERAKRRKGEGEFRVSFAAKVAGRRVRERERKSSSKKRVLSLLQRKKVLSPLRSKKEWNSHVASVRSRLQSAVILFARQSVPKVSKST